MRAGLVAVGTAIAIVGVGVVAAVTLPYDNPAITQLRTAAVDGLTSHAPWMYPFETTSTPSATLQLEWSASSAANVSWYEAYDCTTTQGPSICFVGGPLASWTGNSSGTWITTAHPSTLYCLWVVDAGSDPVNFSAQFEERYHASPMALPTLPLAWTVVGGLVLLSIGAVATYLGLFLPGGVYREPEAPVPVHDAEPPVGGPPPAR